MIKISSIAAQVKWNCDISDAQFWGYYSPCGLLLRMRDLYRIEHNMKPWEPVDTGRIKDWIDEKENAWHELEHRDFRNIEINGKSYKPFDAKGINAVLAGHGLVYGAGYGNMLKPVFLLAELSDRFPRGRYTVSVAGREVARDLSTSPAMVQGNRILVRHQTMKSFLWDKYEEMKTMKCGSALFHAFSAYGLSGDAGPVTRDIEARFAAMVRDELATYIYHETGEASQRRHLGKWWKELLLKFPHTRAELYLRGLKDVLSDTSAPGMLAHIIKEKKTGSLSFYIALLGGIRRGIHRSVPAAYETFVQTGDWEIMEKARAGDHRKTKQCVKQLRELYDQGKLSQQAIERELAG